MGASVYEIVTNQIIEKLESGVIPWQKPWVNGGAVNWKTQKPYRGINTFLLEDGEYATFKQIKEAKGHIKKGEQSHIVVFWKWIEKEDGNNDGKKTRIPFLRYYRVFEINTQVEGLKSKRKEQQFEHEPIVECEKVVKGYHNSPTIAWQSGRAYYRPDDDFISVPPLKDFREKEEYYSTLFHEMIHSTGHESRLNRKGIEQVAMFGSETYSKEELLAEMGASMLCGVTGISNRTIDNSAAYIKSWLRALKDDKTMVVKAAGQAQKAADYILIGGE